MSITMFFFIVVAIIALRYTFIRYNKALWLYFKGGPYGDAATYFFLIQFFRSHSCGTPDERCLLSKEPVLVPSAYMKIVGKLFNDNTLLKNSWLPNFILYGFATAFFFIQIYLNPSLGTGGWVYMALLFVLQADNICLDKHRIHFTVLQPRYFGVLINSAFWFVYVIMGITGVSFVYLSILAVLSVNTSIFCRQTTFFSIVITSALSLSAGLFMVLPVTFIVSAILFPNEFIPSILPQLKYSYQYYLNFYKPAPSANPVIHFVKNAIARAMYDSYPYFAPILVFLGANYLYVTHTHFGFFSQDILKRLSLTYLSIFIIFVITGLRKFAFLGECWRYFSFTTYFLTPFFIPVLVTSLNIPDQMQTAILAGILLICILLAFFSDRDSLENKNPQLIGLLADGNGIFNNAVWYGIPYRVATTAVALGFGKKTFEYQYGNHSQEIHAAYFAEYPYLKWNSDILAENSVTHVLVENELMDQGRRIAGFDTDKLIFIAANQFYSIYKV